MKVKETENLDFPSTFKKKHHKNPVIFLIFKKLVKKISSLLYKKKKFFHIENFSQHHDALKKYNFSSAF